MDKFTEIPIKSTNISLIIIHDSSWTQDGINPEMIVDSGIENGIEYIIVRPMRDAIIDEYIDINEEVPDIGEEVWVWDKKQPNCDPIIDKRINAPVVEWKESYGVTHWKPIKVD